MVWLSLCLSLFLSHTVTVSDLLAAVIVNIDVYAVRRGKKKQKKTAILVITVVYVNYPGKHKL